LVGLAAAITLQLAFVTQLIITLVYWTVLWQKDLLKVQRESDSAFRTYLWWHKVLIHILPALTVVINTLLTKVVFIPGHALYMILMGVTYLPFNYWGTIYTGEPLYHFMPWNDCKTLVNGFIVFLIAATI
jgi:hypothetical protein